MLLRLSHAASAAGGALAAAAGRSGGRGGRCVEDEAALVDDLAIAHLRLRVHSQAGSGTLDVSSEAGRRECAKFLRTLTTRAELLRCEVADRSYREAFSKNYREVFPDAKRRYRTDVLEAPLRNVQRLAMNGAEHELSQRTVELGCALLREWDALGTFLRSWRGRRHSRVSDVEEARSRLVRLDAAWARFEEALVLDLMKIETQARALVLQAARQELQLQHAEVAHGASSCEGREARRRLARTVALLNARATARRRSSRGDLGGEVIDAAFDVLAEPARGGEEDAARDIAQQVVDSFGDLREYIRQAGAGVDALDPHLGQNADLSDRLADWEETWDIGRRFLSGPSLRRSFSAVVASVEAARRQEPALAAHWEDCDVEVLMALPRVMWLAYLRSPAAHAAFMRSLLPGAFVADDSEDHRAGTAARRAPAWSGAAGGESPVPAAGLLALEAAYRRLEVRLADTATGVVPEAAAVSGGAWALLLRRAVCGETGAMEVLEAAERAAIERFMRDLERWSLAVQRHCPDDWNSSAAVILRRRSGEQRRDEQRKRRPSGGSQV